MLLAPSTKRRRPILLQVGMPRHRLGRCEVPTIPHVYALRGLHRPLRFAMAQNDEDGVRTSLPLVRFLRTSTGSAAYPSTHHPRKITFFKCGPWRTKRRPAKLPESSIPPPTSVGMRYGSSSVTGIDTKPADASA